MTTPADYFYHHLTHWHIGSGFWTLNLDTLVISYGICALLILLGMHACRALENKHQATPPSRFCCAMEFLVTFARETSTAFYGTENIFASVFFFSLLIFLGAMNLTCFLPPDLFPSLLHPLGIETFRPQAASDLNFALAISASVTGIVVLYPFWVYGMQGTWGQFCAHPLPHWTGAPINFTMGVLSLLGKGLSLMVRLFMNLFLGDLGFIILGSVMLSLPSFCTAIPFVISWWIWMAFHCLVIPLQTYLFTLFSSIYLQLALNDADPKLHSE